MDMIGDMIGRLWRALLAAASVRFWIMVGAAIAMTAVADWVIWLIVYHWEPLVEAGRRIDILGKALWIILSGIILVVIALTGKRVEVSGAWGRLDVSGGDEPDPPATVTTTTRTEIKP